MTELSKNKPQRFLQMLGVKESHKKGGLQQTWKGGQATENEENTSVQAREGGKEGTMQAASH